MVSSAPDGPRLVDDVGSLRALAHPVRLALIERLTLDGPLTATEASELVGESPSACSFHLRQLAKHGFVEETGEGTGRRRPWRITRIGMSFDPEAADPAVASAGTEVARLLRERQLERYRRWVATRSSWPETWRQAAIDSEYAFWVTPEELTALGNELGERLLALGRSRLGDRAARPEGSVPVELLLLAYPTEAAYPTDAPPADAPPADAPPADAPSPEPSSTGTAVPTGGPR